MAKYRLYKNGIYGYRYKGYFIVKKDNEGKKAFSIMSEDKTILQENIENYYDAEWEIDKMTVPPERRKVIQDLYKEEIYKLSEMYAYLMEKDNGEGLDRTEKELYKWVKKIRTRKAKNKPY